MSETFGKYLRKLRLERRIGLREFAKLVDILPSNLCHIEMERQIVRDKDFLQRIVKALKLKENSKEYNKLFDLAAKPGEIPSDVKDYQELVKELPVLASTIKNKKLTRRDIEKLIEDIKKL